MIDAPPLVMLDASGEGWLMRLLEATPGIEPGYMVLQTTRKARLQGLSCKTAGFGATADQWLAARLQNTTAAARDHPFPQTRKPRQHRRGEAWSSSTRENQGESNAYAYIARPASDPRQRVGRRPCGARPPKKGKRDASRQTLGMSCARSGTVATSTTTRPIAGLSKWRAGRSRPRTSSTGAQMGRGGGFAALPQAAGGVVAASRLGKAAAAEGQAHSSGSAEELLIAATAARSISPSSRSCKAATSRTRAARWSGEVCNEADRP